MATGILIYEQDKYLLRLLTERLRNMLPNVYIADGTNKTESRDATQFCSECVVLYDKRQYEDKFRDDPKAVSVFEDGIIDCRKLIKMLKVSPITKEDRDKDVRVTFLLSFVYVREREEYIRTALGNIRDSDISLRVDLTPRIKCSAQASGSMAELMAHVYKKRFTPEQILDYCSLDDAGFFTPGAISSSIDFDYYPPEVCRILTEKIRSLSHDDERDITALIVADSIKTGTVVEAAKNADRVILLLPDSKAQFGEGMCDLIARLSRAVKGIDIEIVSLDNLNGGGELYEGAV